MCTRKPNSRAAAGTEGGRRAGTVTPYPLPLWPHRGPIRPSLLPRYPAWEPLGSAIPPGAWGCGCPPAYRQGPRPSGRAQCPWVARLALGIHPEAERHLPAGRAEGRRGRWPVLSARRAGWRRLRRRRDRRRLRRAAVSSADSGGRAAPPVVLRAAAPPLPRAGRAGGAALRAPRPPAPVHPPAQIDLAGPGLSSCVPTAPAPGGLQCLSGPGQASS